MFTSTTLRSVMSALTLVALFAVAIPAANACDGNKVAHPAKVERPSLIQALKHLFNHSGKSTKTEPVTDDGGYIPTDDSYELPISG